MIFNFDKLRLSTTLAAGSLCAALLAQGTEDALRYSWILPGGTARSWAMGGAFGAVGADPANASINPAGLGLYNTTEVSMTPSFEVNDARSLYYGTATTAAQQRLSMQNMALTLYYPNEGKNWRGGSFGISFDRQSSYNWKERAASDRVPSSILERFVDEANGTNYSEVEGGVFPYTSTLAWWTYGIDTIPGYTDQFAAAIPFGTNVAQTHDVDASGRYNNTSFFYANNYKDKLYLGATLGLVGVRFERYTTHQERTTDESIDLETLKYKEDLITSGNGIDLKIGVLGRVTDHLRLGVAFHSPAWLLLNDSYSYSMLTDFRAGDGYVENSPSGTFSYRVKTPWRAVASMAYQVGKVGIVSVDYTYTDYRNMRMRQSEELVNGYDFAYENELIRNNYRGTHGVRAGTEWRAGPWYFRAGWAFVPAGFDAKDPRQGSAYRIFTGGLGYRQEHFNIDLGAVYGMRDTKWYAYSPDLTEPVQGDLKDVRTLITVSLRP